MDETPRSTRSGHKIINPLFFVALLAIVFVVTYLWSLFAIEPIETPPAGPTPAEQFQEEQEEINRKLEDIDDHLRQIDDAIEDRQPGYEPGFPEENPVAERIEESTEALEETINSAIENTLSEGEGP